MHIIGRRKSLAKGRINLVTRLRDSRADRGSDARSLGTKSLHHRDRVFKNTALRAAPSGVRGADNAGLAVGEKDGRAVGGDDAKR